MKETKNPSNIVTEVHEAWILTDKDKVRYGCLFGLVCLDPEVDIMTSPIVSYSHPANAEFVEVITRSGSTYRVVNPDSDFMKQLLTVMDDK